MVDRRGEFKEYLLAVLASSRELPIEHDVELADTFLDHIETELKRGDILDAARKQKRTVLARRGELGAGIASCIGGLLGVLHVHEQFQALALLGTADSSFGTVQSAMRAGMPMMLIVSILLIAVAVGACCHALGGTLAGLRLLLLSTALLTGCLVLVNLNAGMYLSTLIFAHYVAPATVPLVSVGSLLLAVLASGAGLTWRDNKGRSKTVQSFVW